MNRVLLTLLPRSLKMISTSRIGPNCYKERFHVNKRVDADQMIDTYAEHRTQVWISESKGYVRHVKTLWLRFGIGCGGRSRCCPCWNAAGG